jgi:hypothetical protein
MDMHPEMKRMIEEEDWDYFARMARSFELEITSQDKELLRLSKELQMLRAVVHAHLSSDENRAAFISTNGMVRMYAVIKKLEGRINKYHKSHGEFLMFLRAILHKMKKEKLVVYKKMEKAKEFLRHHNGMPEGITK